MGFYGILMTGGGPSDFLGSEILAQSEFFWVYEIRRDFFLGPKKTEGFFGIAEKGPRGFLGYAKNLGRQILKL